ncbi:16S rRNA (cytosine(1402)-N(4))-methyltransferase RsmH [Candidatus Dependentiae bacterium]|nr:16S rRNA (cytosine(1402)-N(4))-methyltransferase RsmH [Candidatus Dependentiae bacterium]
MDNSLLNSKEIYHKSVLPREVLEQLNIKTHGTYIDVTFGGGGHTGSILRAEPTCKVIAFDWDKIALETNGAPLKEQFGERLELLWGNFAHLDRLMKKHNLSKVDGILADFGTSQNQIHEREGFSFRKETALDMRMSPGHQKVWARDLIAKMPEKELATLIFEYGEDHNANKIARAIVQARGKKRIMTTLDLAQLIESVVPIRHNQRIHPATKTFQALRIAVNHELDNIVTFLKASVNYLKLGGRLLCISFHSLEDRIVKNFYKEQKNTLTILTKKPIVAGEEELFNNPSARSAKLRVAEKCLQVCNN